MAAKTVLEKEPVKKASSAEPVVLASAKYRVRLRGSNIPALSGCISGKDKEGRPVEERYTLPPNRWVAVRKIVYEYLKGKFDKTVVHEVPDWEPGGENDRSTRETRQEEYQPYIIEFA